MAVQVDGSAPYAPFSVIKSVIERHRQVGMSVITADVLSRMGVTDSLVSRSIQALKLLDLVDEGGKPTPELEAIRKASTDDLGPRLSELIRRVYAPVFEVVDPTTATPQQIADSFRGFTPSGQRERMVTLFTGLMAYAGMVEAAPRRTPGPRPTRTAATNGQRSKASTPNAPTPPIPPSGDTEAPAAAGGRGSTDEHARIVVLRTGGTIALTVDMNPLVLRGTERKFFNALVDLLDEYEDDSPPANPRAGALSEQPGV